MAAAEMKPWGVRLEAVGPRGTLDQDAVFEVLERLQAHHAGGAGFEPDGSRISVSLWVEAVSIEEALAVGKRALLQALIEVLDEDDRRWQRLAEDAMVIEAAEIKPWPRLEEELRTPNYPILLGVSELAEMLGVSKQRVSELSSGSQFPRPLALLKAGPVWDKASIGNFLASWPRKPGRPRKHEAMTQASDTAAAVVREPLGEIAARRQPP